MMCDINSTARLRRESAMTQAALADIDRHLQSLDSVLEGNEFLLGDTLSLADISVYSQLFWMDKIPEGKAAIDTYPGIGNWMQRIEADTKRQV